MQMSNIEIINTRLGIYFLDLFLMILKSLSIRGPSMWRRTVRDISQNVANCPLSLSELESLKLQISRFSLSDFRFFLLRGRFLEKFILECKIGFLSKRVSEIRRFMANSDERTLRGLIEDFLKKEIGFQKINQMENRFLEMQRLVKLGCEEGAEIGDLLPREIHVHSGPTNSGKTHAAMLRLIQASSGIFCAPLRLLAWEGWKKISESKNCQLLTGQERIKGQADHIACTMESTVLNRKFQVAVIDEVQLIGDPRGWAWTRVLRNIKASEIHICGDGRVTDLLRKLLPNDVIKEHFYDRLSGPLILEDKAIESLENIEKGDCLIFFNRKSLIEAKTVLEETHGKKVSCLYGALPPETRRQEIDRFNSGASEILLATDCIGWGLNFFGIKRIIFSSLRKYDGESLRYLDSSEVRQISGRSGRFKQGDTTNGKVAVMRSDDLHTLFSSFGLQYNQCSEMVLMNSPLPMIERASIFPSDDRLIQFCEIFASQNETGSNVVEALRYFFDFARFDRDLFFISQSEIQRVIEVAKALQDISMSISKKIKLVSAPIVSSSELSYSLQVLREIALHESQEIPEDLMSAKFAEELIELERLYLKADLYCWAVYNDLVKIDLEQLISIRAAIAQSITDTLSRQLPCQ